jgi:hypothetical protein
VSTAPTDEWRNVTGSVGRLTVSPLSVYEGSAGIPPAHRVGVVVVAGHGKGNRGVSVDSLIEAWVVGQSTDPLAERPTVHKQQWTTAVCRLTGLVKHGWWVSRWIHWQRPSHCAQATADNSGVSVDGFSKAHAVGRSTAL